MLSSICGDIHIIVIQHILGMFCIKWHLNGTFMRHTIAHLEAIFQWTSFCANRIYYHHMVVSIFGIFNNGLASISDVFEVFGTSMVLL